MGTTSRFDRNNNNGNAKKNTNNNNHMARSKSVSSYNDGLPNSAPFCVWLGNLPAEATSSDIVKYLEPLKIEPRDIDLVACTKKDRIVVRMLIFITKRICVWHCNQYHHRKHHCLWVEWLRLISMKELLLSNKAMAHSDPIQIIQSLQNRMSDHLKISKVQKRQNKNNKNSNHHRLKYNNQQSNKVQTIIMIDFNNQMSEVEVVGVTEDEEDGEVITFVDNIHAINKRLTTIDLRFLIPHFQIICRNKNRSKY